MKQPFHFLLEDDVVLSVYVYVFVRTYMQALKFYQLVFVRLLSVRMKFVLCLCATVCEVASN